jgi:hypothetical protein
MYVILVHDQPELLQRLISSIDEPQHTIIIHVDAKVIQFFFKFIT